MKRIPEKVIQDALAAIPAPERSALLLRYHTEFTLDEIAEILGRELAGSVEQMLDEAEKAFINAMKNQGYIVTKEDILGIIRGMGDTYISDIIGPET